MKGFTRMGIYPAGMVVCAVVLRYISYPDSIMVCLAVGLGFVTAGSLPRMCDRLLDLRSYFKMLFGRDKRKRYWDKD